MAGVFWRKECTTERYVTMTTCKIVCENCSFINQNFIVTTTEWWHIRPRAYVSEHRYCGFVCIMFIVYMCNCHT